MSDGIATSLAVGAGTAALAGAALPLAARVNEVGLSALKTGLPTANRVVMTGLVASGLVGAATTSVLGGGESRIGALAAGVGAATLSGVAAGLILGGVGARTGAVIGAMGGVFGAVGATLGASID